MKIVHQLIIHDKQLQVAFRRRHVPGFLEPENFPSNSPDLIPMDCSTWEQSNNLSTITAFTLLNAH